MLDLSRGRCSKGSLGGLRPRQTRTKDQRRKNLHSPGTEQLPRLSVSQGSRKDSLSLVEGPGTPRRVEVATTVGHPDPTGTRRLAMGAEARRWPRRVHLGDCRGRRQRHWGSTGSSCTWLSGTRPVSTCSCRTSRATSPTPRPTRCSSTTPPHSRFLRGSCRLASRR